MVTRSKASGRVVSDYPWGVRTRVIIPTYNEAENILTAIEGARAALPDADVLVVDDGSPDGTADLVEKFTADLGLVGTGRIEVLRRTEKNGLGAAYLAGFRRSLDDGYEVLVEMDADGSHDPAMLASLTVLIPGAADLVIGSRYVPGGTIPDWGFGRAMLSRWGNRYAALVLGLAINDATAGYRAYNADILRKLDLNGIRAGGYAFQIEMAYRVVHAHGRVVEVPIRFVDRTLGTSKMSSRIVFEALGLVTVWGVRDRLLLRKIRR